MPNPIIDPTGRAGAAAEVRLAPRPTSLRGATVGLLENRKHNAALFLEELGRALVEDHGVAGYVMRAKGSIVQTAEPPLVEELVRECDVVITGVGDCGSCSASAVADGLLFESRGVPAVVICSDAFVASAGAMARLRGVPDYRYLTTPHPVAVLTPEEVRRRARALLPEVMSLLVAPGARSAA
jgi:hypothetical protein